MFTRDHIHSIIPEPAGRVQSPASDEIKQADQGSHEHESHENRPVEAAHDVVVDHKSDVIQKPEVTNFKTAREGIESLMKYIRSPNASACGNPVLVGGPLDRKGDGVWTVCADRILRDGQPCVVYSFGICNDFSFDDEMNLKGCEVHSFDPSMGVESYSRSKTHWFHDAGISGIDDSNYTDHRSSMLGKGVKPWVVKTIPSWMSTLSHNHISLLKVDVEYCEWDALNQLLKSPDIQNIDQIIFEVHFWPGRRSNPEAVSVLDAVQSWMDVLITIEKAGFQHFSTHENPMSSGEVIDEYHYPCCFEVGYVRSF
ncbi:methyltransferase domain-containing protein [Polychytrium aggregatum]|uniref:methyltransferase domain-containing protein n=1 Tax=Polychytrium aggregatum TaxID=110093 RepID=UPI0022FDEA5A|nr:methyltransferase domain-containing protein [Polychytrium aggregatum]KAI9190824.1 methyltransferase domain-containing protein [Polychytrium aggregatum]